MHKEDIEGLPTASAAVGGVRRFVDISVPRNIASNVNELAGQAIVYNVDDLKEVVAANKEERARAAAEAEVLLKVRFGAGGGRGWVGVKWLCGAAARTELQG